MRVPLLALGSLFAIIAQLDGNETKTSYVTCDLRGALGNQMFGIAATLSYALDYGAIPVFPDLNRTDSGISYNRDRIFFRLDAFNPPRPFINTFRELHEHSSLKIPFQADQKLYGYFQSWKHFDHNREEILGAFAPSPQDLDFLRNRYGELIDAENTVSVHVRTFNARLHSEKRHPFLGLEYYKKAAECFPEEAIFVIFSDRINWCKRHFPAIMKNCIFIDDIDTVQDLFLMSMMKNHIIANSSFSWWAAYLDTSLDKKVIAPAEWIHPSLQQIPFLDPEDFYFPEWIKISPDLDAPYPEDMTKYDITRSLDE